MESLKEITSRLIRGFLTKAVKQRNFFINDIPDEMAIGNNREWLASVVSNLLYAVVSNSTDSCVRVTARKHHDSIVLEIIEAGAVNNYSLACSLQQVHALAGKMGGNVTISLRQDKQVAISFNFPELLHIAA